MDKAVSKCHHILVGKRETRDDKYGQNHRGSCTCGHIVTNWHTKREYVDGALREERAYLISQGRMDYTGNTAHSSEW